MKTLHLLFVLLVCTPAWSAGTVYQKTTDAAMEETYRRVYEKLEANRFYVVFEPDIGANLSGFADRWGEDYNRNRLTAIRSMVFCNAWYANQVSNADPDMLALCPLHITLTEKDGRTTVLFSRPTVIARGSGAEKIAAEIEDGVIRSLEQALATDAKQVK
jgi:uncharacterized protein (DUF302 family)